MDKLSVRTDANAEGQFSVCWQWRQNDYSLPAKGGTVTVTLDAKHQEDRAILAEIAAIHYLLEVRQIHGANRLGTNLKIEVSSGAIKKAVAKGAIRKNGKGGTDKKHVADCATFLATKYFEAEVDTGKWRDDEPKTVETHSIHMVDYPVVPIFAALLSREVTVSRHAMFRAVGRIKEKRTGKDADSLIEVPESRWSAAWGWFVKILKEGSNIRIAQVAPKEWDRIVREYQCKPIILHFPDDQAILVIKETPYGLVVVTVLRDHEYTRIIEKPPVQAGQILRVA